MDITAFNSGTCALLQNQFSVIIYGIVYVSTIMSDLRDSELHQGHFVGHIQ